MLFVEMVLRTGLRHATIVTSHLQTVVHQAVKSSPPILALELELILVLYVEIAPSLLKKPVMTETINQVMAALILAKLNQDGIA